MALYFTAYRRVIAPRFGNLQIPDGEVQPMTIMNQMHWFAIQARLGAEAAAESNLRALEVETFLPLVRRVIRRSSRAPRFVLPRRGFFCRIHSPGRKV